MIQPAPDLPTLPEKAVLYAYDIFPDGTSSPVEREGLIATAADGAAYRWIHLNLACPEIVPWIEHEADDVVATSLTLEDTRPRCAQHKDGFLVNLRGVNLNPESKHEDMVSIRLWVTERLIVSVRIRKLMAIVAIHEQVDRNASPHSTANFLSRLAAGLTSKMDPVITDLSDTVDEFETHTLDEENISRSDLATIRRKAIILRRYIAPQRDALNTLAFSASDMIDDRTQASLREATDRVMRMVEELDAVRERCTILKDQLTDQRAEEMNARLMVLSVVTAIFLPLGFLTGLFGINIGGMPGTENAAAFWIFASVLTALGLIQLWWFRHKKWF
ncbi:zinc transporter ZntB [Parvularcula marina]|uniref:Zinc transporter ZntB n=1 Tax=Parvularcula marina TaxID=2292771 RepID=A0A371RH87_9PROT|nr:zinc transporter ZntB [Parvularcula marina]RFB04802.1 zinc transporter ZntB [Parvularcula marina]